MKTDPNPVNSERPVTRGEILDALRTAQRQALVRRQCDGVPVVIVRNGKLETLPADTLLAELDQQEDNGSGI